MIKERRLFKEKEKDIVEDISVETKENENKEDKVIDNMIRILESVLRILDIVIGKR